ncbi:hypothetical protein ACTI_60920 [Actinoplanes sp. OR16]|uniref:8-oxoguanine DNA glycosylase OGG fold protein n=1 Tax=Actinoplanes sp. OR16 TaxID=946334 RepID=UPI000F6ED04C|nr:hypothetical protein [Actinoplanes sp. OR16]BBH69407.1 hypothetical protein ACTI_60920 [Actinoplanes sp. OR16]
MELPEDASAFDRRVVSGGLFDDEIAWLRSRRAALAERTGGPDDARALVAAHTISVYPDKWTGFGLTLPASVSRAHVAAVTDPLELLKTSFAWGSGTRQAYGPHRLGEILVDAQPAKLDAATAALQKDGPVAAYRVLLSGEHKIAGLGPAFFTKFLYFTDSSALILDKQLAAAMRRFWERRHTAGDPDPEWLWRPPTWSSYRYHVYLAFMTMAAARLSDSSEAWTTDLIERLLFGTPLPS